MPSAGKQTAASEKVEALRDLPSEANNFASNPLEYSPFKDQGTIPDSAKLSGIKRQQSSSPSSPSIGQLVYVRRKLETEPNKACLEHEGCNQDHLGSEHVLSGRHHGDLVTAPTVNKSTVSSFPPDSETLVHGEEHLKERFIRLQMFLKNSNQCNQDEYIQKLRSLSAAGRSVHAVELEKRAIQLLLDEGRELQRMKSLNVLGKPFP